MKFYLLLIFVVSSFNGLLSQALLSEDFESYNNYDLITIVSDAWKLWPGGTDTPVTTDEAASGKNALVLVGGKNTDLYFPFKNRFTAGSIQFSMDLLVPEGGNGYFSFQGNEEPGIVWSMECYLDANGFFRMQDQSSTKLQNAYPQDRWFKMSVDINFDSHLWRFYVDGNCVGSYVQDVAKRQSVASLALYSGGESSKFYVDNILFEHKSRAEELSLNHDAAILGLLDANSEYVTTNSIILNGINGTAQEVNCRIKNTGEEIIKTLELAIEQDEQVTSQNYAVDLKPGFDTIVGLEKQFVYNGELSSVISIATINGVDDENSCNNSAPLNLNGFTLHPEKKVWIEEATGTWCGWCPRGDVIMNHLSTNYPDHFVGIAVHQSDPMELSSWMGEVKRGSGSRVTNKQIDGSSTGLSNYIKGFPSAYINRQEIMDPYLLELAFLKSASEEPVATLFHGAKWDAKTRELELIVQVNIDKELANDVRLVVGITEDELTGVGRGWSQTNFYANGTQGIMGGYELLPAKVPDSSMVYNNVAKMLLSSFEGDPLQNNQSEVTESTLLNTYKVTIPEDWNLENLNIVSAVRKGSSEILNANTSTVLQAVSDFKN